MKSKVDKIMDEIEQKWKSEVAELTRPSHGRLVYELHPSQLEGVVDIWDENGFGSHGEVIQNEERDEWNCNRRNDDFLRYIGS